jgi:hypothetical protein
MSYSIEPAYIFKAELSRLILKAGTDPANKWFFSDGAFTAESALESSPNTWLHENFAVICEKEIIAYFEGIWNRPLDIVTSFRLILLNKRCSCTAAKAFFQYLEYIFSGRGCNAFNWIVAEKNVHAYRIYEKIIKDYFGHKVGKRHCGQKAYNGEISDIVLYEITRDEYLTWKNRIHQNTEILSPNVGRYV